MALSIIARQGFGKAPLRKRVMLEEAGRFSFRPDIVTSGNGLQADYCVNNYPVPLNIERNFTNFAFAPVREIPNVVQGRISFIALI